MSFHLSGHTFRFCWTVQDLEVFLVQSNSPLSVKGLILIYHFLAFLCSAPFQPCNGKLWYARSSLITTGSDSEDSDGYTEPLNHDAPGVQNGKHGGVTHSFSDSILSYPQERRELGEIDPSTALGYQQLQVERDIKGETHEKAAYLDIIG